MTITWKAYIDFLASNIDKNNQPLPHPCPPDLPLNQDATQQPIIPIRQTTRIRTKPKYLEHYHCNLLPSQINNTTSTNLFPLSSTLSCDNPAPTYKKLCSVSSITKPRTYLQASKHGCRNLAMKTELGALDPTSIGLLLISLKVRNPLVVDGFTR